MKKTVLIAGLVLSAGALSAFVVAPMPLPRPIVIPAPIIAPEVRPAAAVPASLLEMRIAAAQLAATQA